MNSFKGGFPRNTPRVSSVSIKGVDNSYDSSELLAIKGISFLWELDNVTSPLFVSDLVESVDVLIFPLD